MSPALAVWSSDAVHGTAIEVNQAIGKPIDHALIAQ